MTQTPPHGATRVAEDDKRTLWPWLLLAALIAALLVWWLVAALTGDDDADVDTDAAPGTTTTEVTETTEATETTTEADPTDGAPASPTAAAVAVPGAVLVGDLDALAPDVDLSANLDQPVEADTVQVQEVVADEAFYVGPEAGQTILVRLQSFAGGDAPESPFEVEAGDTVSFTGALQQVDDEFLSELRLYDASEELTTGDFYVQVEDITLAQ
ncbi:hypothetical protein [Blastococcus sp. VKM Ac-2987]|uniref:hypothetical protein n=1 Tax=Blastococcus sp. VKM Ac-2987 TaxID=3004141 RepID=UPI0022AB7EDF|nr:hypothetical protein [Blastococcus sp. VKM Ac-2987]MCZ2858713.1 hypothetical protein [Blastococcus sp. VKM Ac-2987]